jgi:multiple antibiotic resistance protein
VVWLFYRSADRVAALLGPIGSRALSRLIGFLLLCIGVQVMVTGVVDILAPLLARR